jgi:hypothetical protein
MKGYPWPNGWSRCRRNGHPRWRSLVRSSRGSRTGSGRSHRASAPADKRERVEPVASTWKWRPLNPPSPRKSALQTDADSPSSSSRVLSSGKARPYSRCSDSMTPAPRPSRARPPRPRPGSRPSWPAAMDGERWRRQPPRPGGCVWSGRRGSPVGQRVPDRTTTDVTEVIAGPERVKAPPFSRVGHLGQPLEAGRGLRPGAS